MKEANELIQAAIKNKRELHSENLEELSREMERRISYFIIHGGDVRVPFVIRFSDPYSDDGDSFKIRLSKELAQLIVAELQNAGWDAFYIRVWFGVWKFHLEYRGPIGEKPYPPPPPPPKLDPEDLLELR